MPDITHFREIRFDGKVIPQSMSLEAVLKLGWDPQKIAAIAWESQGQSIELRTRHGFLAQVLPTREGIAVIEEYGEGGPPASLSLVNPDGRTRVTISNTQEIHGQKESGCFRWYENARVRTPVCFGVVFELDKDHSQFQLDLDASTGALVAAHAIR